MKSANGLIVAALAGLAAMDIACATALVITGQPWTIVAALFTPIAVPIVGGLLVFLRPASTDKEPS